MDGKWTWTMDDFIAIHEKRPNLTIRQITLESYNNALAHGFKEGTYNVYKALALIASEVGEAIDAHQKSIEISEHGLPALGEELADIIIRVCDLAYTLDIDLEEMIIKKMTFNESRPYRHGGEAD